MNNKLINKINYTTVFILIITVFFTIYFSYISADAPYYIGIARDIANGLVPYKDVKSAYVPLMMYVNSIFFLVIDSYSNYTFIIFNCCITFFSSFVFYKIALEKSLNKSLALFFSLFLFISVLSSEGSFINLEVYVILFVLISYYYLIKKQLVLSGLFLALCVFSKQYGILNYPPFLLLIFYHYSFNKNYYLKFILGSMIPVGLFFFYYNIIEEVSIIDLFEQLSGKGYLKSSFSKKTEFGLILIATKVFILLLIPLVLIKINFLKNKLNIILILGIILNLLPLLIQAFSHYVILTFPYIFLLYISNFKNFKNYTVVVSFIIIIIFSSLLMLRNYRYKDLFKDQIQNSKKYEKKYKKSEKVFIYGDLRYMYLTNDYQNPLNKEVGYSFFYEPVIGFENNYNLIK